MMRNHKSTRWFVALFTVCLLSLVACEHTRPAKVEYKPQPPSIKIDYHVVARGDTLFLIAWSYGLDYRELARINGIKSPYNLSVGQRLDLHGGKPAKGVAVYTSAATTPVTATTVQSAPATRRSSGAAKSVTKSVAPIATAVPPIKSSSATPAPTSVKAAASTTTVAAPSIPEAEADNAVASSGAIGWQWPASGKMLGGYSTDGKLNKGIDIAGNPGDPVLASASGKVVYAGSGLLGYGQLIIIKHNDEFLSAYAHNRTLLVSEGQSVNSGQKIAEIGSSGTTETKLHFEIRQNGKPVDPLSFLPRR